jgi:hypothetical protein
MTKSGDARREKEAKAKLRACLNGERDHIRAGWWSGPAVDAVTVLGDVWEMHGTVCTCCPKREESA